jgi:glycerol kinase
VARDSGLRLGELRVDGGACRNDFLMQFQADLLGVPVRRPPVLEVTALGAAALAGMAVGYWSDRNQLGDATGRGATVFEPAMGEEQRRALYAGWKRAVERSMGWQVE